MTESSRITRQIVSVRYKVFEIKKSEPGKIKKSRGFLLCFFPACTLPQVLCQIQTYCSGDSVPAQVARLAEFERTTASATEQNERTPDWFTLTGFVHAE